MANVDPKYEALFTPWKIGNVEIKNRIVMCPMGGTSLFGWFELTGCGFDKEAAKLFVRSDTGFFFNECQRIVKVFPGGGGLILNPEPAFVNAHLHQFVVHSLRFCHRLIRTLTAGDDGNHIWVGLEIVPGTADPLH